jgi:hypothetical protein
VNFECHKHLNWIFLSFGSLQKTNLPIPQCHKELHAITDSKVLASKWMPQAFELDFPNFWLLAEIKFGNATTPEAFETDFPNFLGPCKN